LFPFLFIPQFDTQSLGYLQLIQARNKASEASTWNGKFTRLASILAWHSILQRVAYPLGKAIQGRAYYATPYKTLLWYLDGDAYDHG
jgi:hypothetical protein